jgi:ferrous iron transport protein B
MKQPAARRQILVTGLANSGKTTVCNQLTGTYALVANYPMTTVEPKTSSYLFEQTLYEVTDMPGINGFTAYSEEELIFRKLAIELRPDILIQCIDANRLKQSLYLTAELFELGLPLVICLTAVDETARKGKMVDSALLSRLLQVPVIEAGLPGGGRLYDLKEAAAHAAAVQNPLKYSEEIERVVQSLSGQIGGESGTARVCALLSLLKDPYVADTASASGDWRYWGLSLSARQSLAAASNALQAVVPGNPAARIIRERGRWVDGISSQVLGSVTPQSSGFALKAAYYSRHPLWGLFFLAAVLLAVYLLVVKAAGWIGEQLETGVGEPIAQFVRDGVASPFLENLLVGDYGLLTLGLLNAVITVLPILSIFFLLLGFLEDVGYLPNLSVLLRRSFKRLGLSGKAVMPIVLGFGCKTMATMTTRSLRSRKERLIAIFLIAFAIPCSAQLGLNVAILGRAGFSAFVLVTVVLISVEAAAGIILNRIITDHSKQAFIQELPPFRTPSAVQILRKTGYRVWWFLKEALPVFIIAALIIFTLDAVGFLGLLKRLLDPLVVFWLGLPIEFVDALILMVAREEAAAGLILRLSRAGMLDYMQSVIAVVVTTMFVPCFANTVAMVKEAGLRAAVLMLIGINISTILIGGVLNWGAVLIRSLV